MSAHLPGTEPWGTGTFTWRPRRNKSETGPSSWAGWQGEVGGETCPILTPQEGKGVKGVKSKVPSKPAPCLSVSWILLQAPSSNPEKSGVGRVFSGLYGRYAYSTAGATTLYLS